MVTYFNSSFLALRGVPDTWIGPLYAVGALVSLLLYFVLPTLMRTFGAYRMLMASAIIAVLVFIAIGTVTNLWLVLFLFALVLISATPLFYILDILLEQATISEDGTGDGRSMLLVSTNIAYVFAPITAGAIIAFSGLSDLYIYAGLILLPFLFFARRHVAQFKDASYTPFTYRHLWRTLTHNGNISRIFYLQFLIKFFYAWMTIYTPIYLNTVVGFSLSEIGIIFTIMLVPFVILQYPLGHFVDKRYGEKEFIILGLTIMATATFYLTFITARDLVLWALLLFTTRVGAAMFEVMSEIYFFKQVNSGDTDIIGSFRALYPLAYITGPLLGSLLLLYVPMQYLFAALAAILLTGFTAAVHLHDTR